MLILPPEKKWKIGQNNPENRQNLSYARGLMPHNRFYIDAPLENSVELKEKEHHHLVHVLRHHIGDTVELVNGKGVLATATIVRLDKKSVTLHIESNIIKKLQEPQNILAVAMMRLAKLEWVIEKGTELGADSFWLYRAENSEKGDFTDHQMERLQGIVISAMKQCGRLDLPSLVLFHSLQELLTQKGHFYYGDLHAQPQKIVFETPAIFITGPESGFSNQEKEHLLEKGVGVLLHANILRAETAPLAAICKMTISSGIA